MCIFCKIVENEIPSNKIYEDDNFIAILDISPVTKGHTLIIPKNHYENIFDLPKNIYTELGNVIVKLSNILKETLNFKGLNILNNNGPVSGQSVLHFHVHLIPRYDNDTFDFNFNSNLKLSNDELNNLCNKIKKNAYK